MKSATALLPLLKDNSVKIGPHYIDVRGEVQLTLYGTKAVVENLNYLKTEASKIKRTYIS